MLPHCQEVGFGVFFVQSLYSAASSFSKRPVAAVAAPLDRNTELAVQTTCCKPAPRSLWG
jgi:hypothetical protein